MISSALVVVVAYEYSILLPQSAVSCFSQLLLSLFYSISEIWIQIQPTMIPRLEP